MTGIDFSALFVKYAKSRTKGSEMAGRIDFLQGDMNALPLEDNIFDWAWSMDCAGYHQGDPIPAIRELVRVVRPGGTVTIGGWSSEMVLPGYLALEERLNADCSGYHDAGQRERPEGEFLRGLGILRRSGLEDVSARTFVADVQAPMSDGIRQAVCAILGMRWRDVESNLSEEDLSLYRRICDPESSEFILKVPDYYAFFTITHFLGRVRE